MILEEVRKSKSHPTADDVYRLVRRRLPRISLGTVYRNLDVLARHGLIQSLGDVGPRRRYDGTVEEHCHVRCVSCGRVDDVDGEMPGVLEDWARDAAGYEVQSCRLSLAGLCPECAARRPGRAAGEKGGDDGCQGHDD